MIKKIIKNKKVIIKKKNIKQCKKIIIMEKMHKMNNVNV